MRISDWSSDVCSSDLVSGDFAVRKRLTSALAGKRMPTEAPAFVERCNPRLIFPVFRPDKEFSGRHPIGKLAHVHAVFCPALAGLAAIIMLLEISHRIKIGRASCRERGGQ